MSYASKETLTYRRAQCEQLRQRIDQIDVELAQVYNDIWQCGWEETRKQEKLGDRRRALERERNNKERELETYL